MLSWKPHVKREAASSLSLASEQFTGAEIAAALGDACKPAESSRAKFKRLTMHAASTMKHLSGSDINGTMASDTLQAQAQVGKPGVLKPLSSLRRGQLVGDSSGRRLLGGQTPNAESPEPTAPKRRRSVTITATSSPPAPGTSAACDGDLTVAAQNLNSEIGSCHTQSLCFSICCKWYACLVRYHLTNVCRGFVIGRDQEPQRRVQKAAQQWQRQCVRQHQHACLLR